MAAFIALTCREIEEALMAVATWQAQQFVHSFCSDPPWVFSLVIILIKYGNNIVHRQSWFSPQ